MTYRRVITAHDAGGRSKVVSDAGVEPVIIPGVCDLYRLWSADQPATFPDAGIDPDASALFPPVGGVRNFIFVLPPNQTAVLDETNAEGSARDLDALMDESGFHASDTSDFEVVISGEATLETEDGGKIVLRPGDTIVHNGASHRWSNEGPVPAVLYGCQIGAHRTAK
jgi:mannose-6-phosphate isomerase-like protein (cupin superfamily)